MTSRSTSNNLSFILYEKKHPPKYFQVNRSFFRFLIIGLPLLAFISVMILIGGALYLKKMKMEETALKPQTLHELKQENQQLLKRQRKLNLLNIQLQKKLNISQFPKKEGTVPEDNFSPSSSLSSFLDLRKDRLFINDQEVVFQFNMVNKIKDKVQIKGYFSVMMKQKNLFSFYPNYSINEDFQSTYDLGETFSFSRLRPVKARFPLSMPLEKGGGEILFKVLIHSKNGELLHRQVFRKHYQKRE